MIPLPEIGDKFDAFTVQYGNKHRCGPFTRIKAQLPRKGALGPTGRNVVYGTDNVGEEWCFYYYHNDMNWAFTFEVICE